MLYSNPYYHCFALIAESNTLFVSGTAEAYAKVELVSPQREIIKLADKNYTLVKHYLLLQKNLDTYSSGQYCYVAEISDTQDSFSTLLVEITVNAGNKAIKVQDLMTEDLVEIGYEEQLALCSIGDYYALSKMRAIYTLLGQKLSETSVNFFKKMKKFIGADAENRLNIIAEIHSLAEQMANLGGQNYLLLVEKYRDILDKDSRALTEEYQMIYEVEKQHGTFLECIEALAHKYEEPIETLSVVELQASYNVGVQAYKVLQYSAGIVTLEQLDLIYFVMSNYMKRLMELMNTALFKDQNTDALNVFKCTPGASHISAKTLCTLLKDKKYAAFLWIIEEADLPLDLILFNAKDSELSLLELSIYYANPMVFEKLLEKGLTPLFVTTSERLLGHDIVQGYPILASKMLEFYSRTGRLQSFWQCLLSRLNYWSMNVELEVIERKELENIKSEYQSITCLDDIKWRDLDFLDNHPENIFVITGLSSEIVRRHRTVRAFQDAFIKFCLKYAEYLELTAELLAIDRKDVNDLSQVLKTASLMDLNTKLQLILQRLKMVNEVVTKSSDVVKKKLNIASFESELSTGAVANEQVNQLRKDIRALKKEVATVMGEIQELQKPQVVRWPAIGGLWAMALGTFNNVGQTLGAEQQYENVKQYT